ncbi:hypothetical protein [Aurantiacibacter marinus]|uniref:hypothetical protein n=1 Tax=Aurantiacibacter marinus TaxID=874156 RepID=UPI00069ACF79|nr:hypothetical protein [Aurantiacibacter marinus]
MSGTREFLHRVDGIRREAQWVTTRPADLRAATFLDGRETFWSAQRVEAIAARQPEASPACRMIFHTGFCGSTLLARLLDSPGSVLVLKEPQALTDIASQAAHIPAARTNDLLSWTLAQITAIAPAGEALAIKPSNWVSGLAPALVAGGQVACAVFLTMELRPFLRAAFRGGRDRLAHCMRLAELLAPQLEEGEWLMQRAMADAADPLDRAALVVALAHRFQLQLFDRAQDGLLPANTARIDHAELIADRRAAVQRAATALGLPPPAENPAGLDLVAHAKDPGRRYSLSEEDEANREIELHHAHRFDLALDWLEGIRV